MAQLICRHNCDASDVFRCSLYMSSDNLQTMCRVLLERTESAPDSRIHPSIGAYMVALLNTLYPPTIYVEASHLTVFISGTRLINGTIVVLPFSAITVDVCFKTRVSPESDRHRAEFIQLIIF